MHTALRTAWTALTERQLVRRVRRNLTRDVRCPECREIRASLDEHQTHWHDANRFGHRHLAGFHGQQIDRLQEALDSHRERDHATAAV